MLTGFDICEVLGDFADNGHEVLLTEAVLCPERIIYAPVFRIGKNFALCSDGSSSIFFSNDLKESYPLLRLSNLCLGRVTLNGVKYHVWKKREDFEVFNCARDFFGSILSVGDKVAVRSDFMRFGEVIGFSGDRVLVRHVSFDGLEGLARTSEAPFDLVKRPNVL